jgi:pyruvate kinase
MTLEQLEQELMNIHSAMVDHEVIANKIAAQVHTKYRLSAKNLYRYLLLRTFDLRSMHDTLSELGLSSLRSAEGYVYSNISNVLNLIHLMQGKHWEQVESMECIGYGKSKKLLRKHAKNLFVESHKRRRTMIMVTLPAEAGENIDLLRNMVRDGMDIARINLGRDDMDTWLKMLENIAKVREEVAIELKVYMDLPGPKLRIADIEIPTSDPERIKSSIRIYEGDKLVVSKKPCKGQRSVRDESGMVIQKARVGVLIPEIIDDVKIGDRVFFDDGKIKAEVIEKREDEIEVIITNAAKTKLRSQKGINLPDTILSLPALTQHDKELLPFVVSNADMIGYSFIQSPEDIKLLYETLDEMQVSDLGVIMKIETTAAFSKLPDILFEAMKHKKIGIMIARGDLAVEIGFERISEVQNEIMWICEAAHIPVIWATQVLQELSKKGVATRAEVSDAAISSQAECVMLNKGPYILEAIRTLKSIIKRMEKHSSKKKSKLRSLLVAKTLVRKYEKTYKDLLIKNEQADDAIKTD